jgi:hypothetical protein
MSTAAFEDPFSDGGKPSRPLRCSPEPTLPIDYPLTKPDGMTDAKWESLSEATKRKLSNTIQDRIAREEAKARAAADKKPRAKSSSSGTFTTQYAMTWAKKQGWKVLDRERYDVRTKRHHDLQLGIDLLCEDPNSEGGMIGIQAAGKGEKAPHYQTFLDRGGPEKAKRRHITVIYVEFVRGSKTPILEEKWA